MLKKDILRTYNMVEGSALKRIIGCCISPGVHAVVVYRFGRWAKRRNAFFRIFLDPIYAVLFYIILCAWGIEIPRSAEIGEGLYVGHCGGITISSSAKIGKNVNISQQVTIGVSGQGDKQGVPIIGDDVFIAPGAKIFGKINVGNNVKIGANAVVYKDIPDKAIVVLDPGFKIISFKGNRSKSDQ